MHCALLFTSGQKTSLIPWYCGFLLNLILSSQNCTLNCVNAFLKIMHSTSKLNFYLSTWCDRLDCCCSWAVFYSVILLFRFYVWVLLSFALLCKQKLNIVPFMQPSVIVSPLSHHPLLSVSLSPPSLFYPLCAQFTLVLSHFLFSLSSLSCSFSTCFSTTSVRKCECDEDCLFPCNTHTHSASIQADHWSLHQCLVSPRRRGGGGELLQHVMWWRTAGELKKITFSTVFKT